MDRSASLSSEIEPFSEADIHTLLMALADNSKRVQRVTLWQRCVWIKRYGTERASLWLSLHTVLAAAVPIVFLKPSPQLEPKRMIGREIRRINALSAKGF